MVKHYNIVAVGLNESERVLVKSLVNLIRLDDQARWSFSEGHRGDAFIVDEGSAEGRGLLKNQGNDSTPIIILGNHSDTNYQQAIHIHKPLRSAELRKALLNMNKILAARNQQKDRSQAIPTLTKVLHKPATAQFTTLLDLLKKGAEQDTPKKVSIETIDFAFHPKENLFVMKEPLDSLKSLDLKTANNIRFQDISTDDFQSQYDQSKAQSLTKLRWYCGIHLSAGQIIKDLTGYASFKLTRWPDFGTLSYHKDHARLATQLMTGSCSLDKLALNTQTPKEIAISFLNACHLCGWLVEGKPLNDPVVTASHQMNNDNNLFNRLRKSLGIH